MSFLGNCGTAFGRSCAFVFPNDGERHKAQDRAQLFGVRDMGVFQIQPSCFRLCEQTFDAPMATVHIEGAPRAPGVGCDDQGLTIFDPLVFQGQFCASV